MPKKGSVDRNTAAVIGRIVSVIAGILAILSGVGIFLEISFVEDLSEYSVGGALKADAIVLAILAILVGIVVLILELDQIVIGQHIVRGILYIILGFFAPGGGLILIIGGIIYIIAEFIK
jgi:hypothetical protein